MSDIKVGDLVMVVKGNPCCGKSRLIGRIFVVTERELGPITKCGICGTQSETSNDTVPLNGLNEKGNPFNAEKWRLKKIDPQAEGDSLPTRADLEVTA